jgi:hypothetical protein
MKIQTTVQHKNCIISEEKFVVEKINYPVPLGWLEIVCLPIFKSLNLP